MFNQPDSSCVISGKSLFFPVTGESATALRAESLPEMETGKEQGGGFYVGLIVDGDKTYALIVAPREEGECRDFWRRRHRDIPDARSVKDGPANTAAMAKVGSGLGKWARDLAIGGFTDWYLPSREELWLVYQALGPVHTPVPAFCEGGEQALLPDCYWSSTQSPDGVVWMQNFRTGGQPYSDVNFKDGARAVRRSLVAWDTWSRG